jgi:hypothetical protein
MMSDELKRLGNEGFWRMAGKKLSVQCGVERFVREVFPKRFARCARWKRWCLAVASVGVLRWWVKGGGMIWLAD